MQVPARFAVDALNMKYMYSFNLNQNPPVTSIPAQTQTLPEYSSDITTHGSQFNAVMQNNNTEVETKDSVSALTLTLTVLMRIITQLNGRQA